VAEDLIFDNPTKNWGYKFSFVVDCRCTIRSELKPEPRPNKAQWVAVASCVKKGGLAVGEKQELCLLTNQTTSAGPGRGTDRCEPTE